MFKFWMLNGLRVQMLHDDPSDGGGGGGEGIADDLPPTGEHPDFDIPGGVGRGEEGSVDDDPAPQPRAQPRAGDPAGRGRQEPVETVPKHRLDEVIAARDEIAERLATTDKELARFKKLIGASLGIVDPDAPDAPKPLTEREQALQARILQLLPPWVGKLQKIADKVDVLDDVAAQMPDFSNQNKQYWTRVARQMCDGMEAKVAPLFLGKGKAAGDMSPEMRARYRSDFFQWVQSNDKRMERYEGLDNSLIDDYAKELDATVVAPLRRQYGAAALTRSREVARLPVSGGAGTPTRTPQPRPKPVDEDEAADRAWANLQERLQEA